MLKVIATDGLHKMAQAAFAAEEGVELSVPEEMVPADLPTLLKNYDVLIVRSATKVTKELLQNASHLKAVIRAGVGVDNIDLPAARKLNIPVWNAPNGNFQSAAELTIAMIFAVARSLPQASQAMKNAHWAKKELAPFGRQILGATLGLFGAGNIGGRVAKMASAIGMNVIICDPYLKDALFEKVKWQELLKRSDFITLHTPFLPETKHKFNYEAFCQMKDSAFVVNVSRGGVMNDSDLLKALQEKQIAGAALDVFEKEPMPFKELPYCELIKEGRLILSPHMGASTKEAQESVGMECLQKVLALKGHLDGHNPNLAASL